MRLKPKHADVLQIVVTYFSVDPPRPSTGSIWPLMVSALVLAPCSAIAQSTTPSPPPCSAPIVLPFDGRKGFVLIEGSVAGTQGVFMVDTGSPYRVLLNRDVVPLLAGRPTSAGAAASGQQIAIQQHDQPLTVDLAGKTGFDLTRTRSGNFKFVGDALGQQFLGFLGVEWLRQYVFIFNYRRGQMTLYPNNDSPCAINKPLSKTVFHFVIDHQLPSVTLDIDGAQVQAHIDTGAAGSIRISPQTRIGWQASGIWHEHNRGKASHVRVDGVRYATSRFALNDLSIEEEPSGAPAVTLGFNFLRHYRSWWDYREGTISLVR